jgi:hypothetical protein
MASNVRNHSPGTQPTAPLRRPRFDAAQRFLLICGVLLVVSGLFHGIVLFTTGGSLEGPLSWRKPTVFGLSFGITAVTIAFVASALRLSKVASWILLGSLGVASVAETALITMQTWRGVPAHFNFATVFDTAVFIAMGVLVTIVAVVLLVLTVLSFTAMRGIPRSLALAIQAGMVLLIVGQILGVLIITTGVQPAAMGDDAAVFGPNGVVLGSAGILKYPHGIALHAVQLLPLLALLGLLTRWNESRRTSTIARAALGYVLITAISTIQAYTGRGGLMLSWFEVAALTVGIMLLVGAGLLILFSADWGKLKMLRNVDSVRERLGSTV